MGRQVGGELGPVGSRGSGRVWLVICIAFVVRDTRIAVLVRECTTVKHGTHTIHHMRLAILETKHDNLFHSQLRTTPA